MRTSRKFECTLIALAITSFVLVFVCLCQIFAVHSFAEGEESDIIASQGPFYVIVHDGGNRLTVKTAPRTVAEILEKLNTTLNASDSVEPNLDTLVDADNFHINIYRSHPVVVKDGAVEKYAMTSSHDPKTIAETAGFIIYDGDEVNQIANTKFLEVGVADVYEITRHGGSTITLEEEVAFSERTIKDFNLAPGTSEVRQLGEVGTKITVYNVHYVDGVEASRELASETITKNPVDKIIAVGVNAIERTPLTARKGRNYYTATNANGELVERQETYYDLPMGGVMSLAKNWEGCSHSGHYSVRDDGVKIDDDGYILVAADLNRYPRCSVVDTSLGQGKVYDTGSFALKNHEQFDIATDWTNHNGS